MTCQRLMSEKYLCFSWHSSSSILINLVSSGRGVACNNSVNVDTKSYQISINQSNKNTTRSLMNMFTTIESIFYHAGYSLCCCHPLNPNAKHALCSLHKDPKQPFQPSTFEARQPTQGPFQNTAKLKRSCLLSFSPRPTMYICKVQCL